MAPVTPLGKPLSQNPLMGPDVPLSSPIQSGVEQPISAFQWVSLVRATWTWVFRPLWYLCFKWPTQLILPVASVRRDEERRREDEEWWEHRKRQEEDDLSERHKRQERGG